MMSLAQRVRDFRYSKGWGPDELASRASISRTALYQIESGKTELPRAGTLRRIAIALDVSMESLLGHGEVGKPGDPGMAAARKLRSQNDWIPAEGGPLTMPTSRPGPMSNGGSGGATFGTAADARFAVEAQEVSQPVVAEALNLSREQELTRKLREILNSPLSEGVARIIEESYRLLAVIH
jgi:transcriptional regulator with XRE-family HTH domain